MLFLTKMETIKRRSRRQGKYIFANSSVFSMPALLKTIKTFLQPPGDSFTFSRFSISESSYSKTPFRKVSIKRTHLYCSYFTKIMKIRKKDKKTYIPRSWSRIVSEILLPESACPLIHAGRTERTSSRPQRRRQLRQMAPQLGCDRRCQKHINSNKASFS